MRSALPCAPDWGLHRFGSAIAAEGDHRKGIPIRREAASTVRWRKMAEHLRRRQLSGTCGGLHARNRLPAAGHHPRDVGDGLEMVGRPDAAAVR